MILEGVGRVGMQNHLINGSLRTAETEIYEGDAFMLLVEKVAQCYQVPLACLALLTPTGIHLKSRVGALPAFLPHPTSGMSLMCRHHVAKDEATIIEDTALCLRVARDPLVMEEPFVRFYVGVPIKKFDRTDVAVGTLCVFDKQPRRFTRSDAEALIAMAWEVSLLFDYKFSSAVEESIQDLPVAITGQDQSQRETQPVQQHQLQDRTSPDMEESATSHQLSKVFSGTSSDSLTLSVRCS
eukprot:TRINITY_DN7148_c0_g1_i1.p1 TRINITY_DN7148_c0_g1~~TRINITY_DN7148_c0_g1_i1.p1  ORF type:complete len:240 (-),score=33.06 TRINITY_DN7148_c0_g1_i1:141-860(-)